MKETPQWLKDLQESSWELEFLISGGAIFTLVQAAGYFTDLVQSVKITNAYLASDLFLILGSFGIQMLTLGFILHLVMRSFWVALVCANYVYPQGVRASRINWKRPFRAAAPEGSDLYELIVKINRLCSAVMYLSVISCFLVAGMIMIGLVIYTLPNFWRLREQPGLNYFFSLVDWIWVFYILDLLLFGLFRKIPYLSYLLYLPFRFFDYISGRVIFQRALWLYNTNVNRWKFAGFMAVFLVLAFFYSYGAIYRPLSWHNIFDQREFRFQLAPQDELNSTVYRDEAGDEKITHMQIPSKLVEGDFLEIFLVYRHEYDQALKKNKDRFRYISDMVQVTVDDSIYQTVAWYPNWRTKNDQLGIIAMLPVGYLKAGPHKLVLSSKVDTVHVSVIPFWKVQK